MKLEEVIFIYNLLGEAKVTTIDFEDIAKIVSNRQLARPFFDKFEKYREDCESKVKPSDFDSIVRKSKNPDSLSKEEKEKINIYFNDFEIKMKELLNKELKKDVEIEFEKISRDTIMKLIKENGWKISAMDFLSSIL